MSHTTSGTTSPLESRPAEMTAAALILGLLLSVIMGAANVYLGLKAGMTVSASIPAAVIAMGVLRGVLGRKSMLESNLVQTAASAGESLAAGIIFTMPALVLIGVWDGFDFWTTSLIALAGGLLGVLLMIPMRRVFVVDNAELRYPEGVACAEVLRAGASDSADGKSTGVEFVLAGIALGGLFKFAGTFLNLINSTVEAATRVGSRIFYVGLDVSPALLAVGYIVGLSISVQIFLGGVIGWLVAMPLLGASGLEQEAAVDAAWSLWSSDIRYMGVGAMLVGGIASIWRVRHGLLSAVEELATLLRSDQRLASVAAIDRNLGGRAILTLGILCVGMIAGLYFILLKHSVGLTVLTTVVMMVMAFFFSAVASYIVGLVGNSNSPVSGMTITAVLGTGLLIMAFGFAGETAMVATLGVAGVVCCVACTSGDVCNDLKTGSLVGASPRNQQIMQVIGVVVAAFVMAPVMTVLHEGSLNAGTGGIGGRELSAPQASLFASLAKGFFGGESLPRVMVAWGVGIGLVLLAVDQLLAWKKSEFRLHVMPVAVGIYLPFGLATPILAGGLLSWFLRRKAGASGDAVQKRGILITSGIIAGESLVGVALGTAAYFNIHTDFFTPNAFISLVAFAAAAGLIAWLSLSAARSKAT